MTPDQQRRLQEKLWSNRARQARPAVASTLGMILKIEPNEIAFRDLAETEEAMNSMVEQSNKCETVELPNRDAAIDFARQHLSTITGPAHLFIQDYNSTGIVSIDFSIGMAHVSALMESQFECFRLVSESSDVG